MKFFFEVFWRGLVFNGMEMAFLYRLRPLARNNALGRTQASGNGTKEMVWNAQARDEGGARWHRGDVKKGGGRFFMVAAVLFVLRCAIEAATGSFFRYETGFLWV